MAIMSDNRTFIYHNRTEAHLLVDCQRQSGCNIDGKSIIDLRRSNDSQFLTFSSLSKPTYNISLMQYSRFKLFRNHIAQKFFCLITSIVVEQALENFCRADNFLKLTLRGLFKLKSMTDMNFCRNIKLVFQSKTPTMSTWHLED